MSKNQVLISKEDLLWTRYEIKSTGTKLWPLNVSSVEYITKQSNVYKQSVPWDFLVVLFSCLIILSLSINKWCWKNNGSELFDMHISYCYEKTSTLVYYRVIFAIIFRSLIYNIGSFYLRINDIKAKNKKW